ATIADYYNLLPDDPEAAWELFTAHLQAALYRSDFDVYQQVCDRYSAVDVSDIHVNPAPDRTYATVTSHYKDGRPPTAVRTFVVVDREDGQWKIDWLWTIDP
ncbi:MAG TPA: hypothetical protein VGD48_28625, partial [Kutzneria sp.]